MLTIVVFSILMFVFIGFMLLWAVREAIGEVMFYAFVSGISLTMVILSTLKVMQ